MQPVPVLRGNKLAMLFSCLAIFSAPLTRGQCIATSANSPATSSDVPFAGSDYSFTNPLNTLLNDGLNAVAASVLQLSNKQTDYIQVKGFGFNIPAAATVCGIQVNVVRSAANVLLNLAYVTDYNVRMMKGGVLTGNNLADGTTQWPATNTTATYGGNGQLWGTTWTPTDINSANFGFSISAEIHGTVSLFPSAMINYISMTVYYLDPSVLPDKSLQLHAASGANRSAVLSWKGDAVDESASVTIERSGNVAKWETVLGALKENATTLQNTFIDSKPLPGRSFYRLKITAPSGEIHYSTVQPFELAGITTLKCYPNPVSNYIQVAGVLPGERVDLTDLLGQRVFLSAPALTNMVSIDMAHLQPGMYVVSAGNRKMKVQKN
jgi:hypothetical protein